MTELRSAAVQDSAEAAPRPRRGRYTAGGYRSRPSVSFGNVLHFIVAVFFLWPIFMVVAVIWSLGDAINFLRFTLEACISSTYWLFRALEESIALISHHPNSPTMQRVRGRRRAMGHEVAKDWANAGRALAGVGRAWSKTFGLGGLFGSLEERVQRANQDWRRYAATGPWSPGSHPDEFPEQYVVVDELPPGGSSARLYVVRRQSEAQDGPLMVLKYFDLRHGGNLESVVRESEAVKLAQRLGLITESNLGERAFWYVMPYYHGETLTKGVLRNHKQARENGTMPAHTRTSLGYVHQLLQIIAQYHEAGVIHKDIKPDNLIIAGDRIYLVDIGLMTPLSSMAQLTTHGTEYFRDPEMVKLALQGREVREVDAAKFDVYSIGAVLFFAVSGEFPTSGALSRLPNDVPLALQWVVNRAMTGMEQRYANARAMLTDVDYLFWAASTNNLEQVKPADLPSFKGMPVPPHLATPSAADTQVRERLAAAPGGYGAWYAAPVYKRKRRGWGVALAALFVVGAMIAGLWLVMFAPLQRFTDGPRIEYAGPNSGSELPAGSARLRPLFDAADERIQRGVNSVRVAHSHAVLDPGNLAAVVAVQLRDGQQELLRTMQPRWNVRGLRGVHAIEYLLVPVPFESGNQNAEFFSGLAEQLQAQAEVFGLPGIRVANGYESGELLDLLLRRNEGERRNATERSHAELARWFARRGEAPRVVILWGSRTTTPGAETQILAVQSIYPGTEHLLELYFHPVAK